MKSPTLSHPQPQALSVPSLVTAFISAALKPSGKSFCIPKPESHTVRFPLPCSSVD